MKDGENEAGKGRGAEKRIEFREKGEIKDRRGRRSQEQPAIITTDPPWYSIQLLY